MEIVLIIATLLGGITAVWFLWEKLAPQKNKRSPARESSVRFHISNHDVEAPAYDGDRAVVQFTLTNISSDILKLTSLRIIVDKVESYRKIVLPDIGAPLEEYMLHANIRNEKRCELLTNDNTQFILKENESDAFRVQCVGNKGCKYSVHFEVESDFISDGSKAVASSEIISIGYPVQSIDDLKNSGEII